MTELEELQRLIDADPELDKLCTLANSNTNSIFTIDAYELLLLKHMCFNNRRLNTFLEIYKIMLSWSSMMGQILQKIHGKDSTDVSALRPISGTDYGYIIYHNPTPWRVRVYLDKDTSTIYINVNVVARPIPSKATGMVSKLSDSHFANIKFILDHCYVDYDPQIGKQTVSLLDSKMIMKVFDEETNSLIQSDHLLVRNFRPEKLEHIINVAFGKKLGN